MKEPPPQTTQKPNKTSQAAAKDDQEDRVPGHSAQRSFCPSSVEHTLPTLALRIALPTGNTLILFSLILAALIKGCYHIGYAVS